MTQVFIRTLDGGRYGPFYLEQMGDLLPRVGDFMHGPDGLDFGRVQGLSWFWDKGLAFPPTSVVILTLRNPPQPQEEDDIEPDFYPED